MKCCPPGMAVLGKLVGRVRQATDLVARQIEFPLRVAVCAWCRPGAAREDGEPLSHGICPRHLREIEFQLRGVPLVPPRRRRKPQEPPVGELLFAF